MGIFVKKTFNFILLFNFEELGEASLQRSDLSVNECIRPNQKKSQQKAKLNHSFFLLTLTNSLTFEHEWLPSQLRINVIWVIHRFF